MGGDKVERELSSTISVLHASQRAKLLNRREVSDIVRKRRHHEYNLLRRNVTRTDYLHYAAFERELHLILKRRAKQRELTKLQVERTVDKTAARVNLIYSRAVRKFAFDEDLWLHYAKHCIKTGSTRAAARVFAKAIAYRNSSERIWLAAIAFHFDTNGDATGARTLAQRALRALPKSVKLWKEYFRLELCYLGKLVARRLAIGLPPDGSEHSEQYSALKPSEDHGPESEDISEEKSNSGAPESGYDASDEINSQSAKEDTTRENHQGSTGSDQGRNRPKSVTEPSSSPELEEAPLLGGAEGIDDAIEQHLRTKNEAQDAPRRTDGNQVDEESSSGEESDDSYSGPESSDKDSLKSEASSDENDTKKTRSPSFWEGGVPFTVFRNASNRLKLSHLDRAEFWDVAASTPFVPPQLLSQMLKLMKAECTESCVAELIAIREPWDIDRTTRKRSLGNKIGEENGEIYLSENDRVELNTHALKVTELLHSAMCSAEFARLPDSAASGVRSVLQSFGNMVKNTCFSKKFEDSMKKMISHFEAQQAQAMLGVEGVETDEDASQDNIKEWTLWKFEALLRESNDALSASVEIYEALKQKVIVPFRSLEQDRLICLYLSRERDLSRIRSFTQAVLALPPVTMESLKAAINAELLIRAESKQSHATLSDEVMIRNTRKLFKRAISLPAAKRDVDLWLSYVDFERSISGDMKEASTASWKARKALMPSFQESFTERLTLRNLAQ
ncbi:U3 snoRNP component Utp6p-like protein [Gracilaria domingensis]|nr:U3 snoRNP component Utp6p-like protein [Gracilaria domingensis]